MHEELHGPLQGWTYDETGTIHTPSGYRCTARLIESALWLLGCYSSDAQQWWIPSDEATGAMRRLFDYADIEADRTPARAVRQGKEEATQEQPP